MTVKTTEVAANHQSASIKKDIKAYNLSYYWHCAGTAKYYS